MLLLKKWRRNRPYHPPSQLQRPQGISQDQSPGSRSHEPRESVLYDLQNKTSQLNHPSSTNQIPLPANRQKYQGCHKKCTNCRSNKVQLIELREAEVNTTEDAASSKAPTAFSTMSLIGNTEGTASLSSQSQCDNCRKQRKNITRFTNQGTPARDPCTMLHTCR